MFAAVLTLQREAARAGPGRVCRPCSHFRLPLAPTWSHPCCPTLPCCSEDQRELAKQTLAALRPQVQQLLGGAPLRVRLQGLEYMNDDPSQARVMALLPSSCCCLLRVHASEIQQVLG